MPLDALAGLGDGRIAIGLLLAFVSGPPPHHEELPAFDCTESRVAPVLDTVFAALEVANFAVAASSTDQQWSDTFNGNPPINRGTAVPLYIALAAVGTFSAYYGYSRTGDCRGPRSGEESSAGHRRPHRRRGNHPAPGRPGRECRPAPPFPRRSCRLPAPPFHRRSLLHQRRRPQLHRPRHRLLRRHRHHRLHRAPEPIPDVPVVL
jgi:hypothetical protein